MPDAKSKTLAPSDFFKKFLLGVTLLSTLSVAIYFGFFSDGHKRLSIQEWQDYEAKMADLKAQLKTLGSEIENAQGKSLCKTDQDCRIVGLGVQVCGEYSDFLVYSTRVANEAKLLELVSDFNHTHETLMDRSFLVKKCGTKPATIRCVLGACRPQAR